MAVPRFVSILYREAEISIHLERPNADLLITRKLTDYTLGGRPRMRCQPARLTPKHHLTTRR